LTRSTPNETRACRESYTCRFSPDHEPQLFLSAIANIPAGNVIFFALMSFHPLGAALGNSLDLRAHRARFPSQSLRAKISF